MVWRDATAPALIGGPARFSVSTRITVPGRGTVPGRVRLLVADGTAIPDQAGAASALVTMIADGTPMLVVTDKTGVVPVRGVVAASAAACAASAAST
jgi:hypothetical protein